MKFLSFDDRFAYGVPAVGGFQPGARASRGKCQLGEVPVGGGASWGKCQLGEVPVGGL